MADGAKVASCPAMDVCGVDDPSDGGFGARVLRGARLRRRLGSGRGPGRGPGRGSGRFGRPGAAGGLRQRIAGRAGVVCGPGRDYAFVGAARDKEKIIEAMVRA